MKLAVAHRRAYTGSKIDIFSCSLSVASGGVWQVWRSVKHFPAAIFSHFEELSFSYPIISIIFVFFFTSRFYFFCIFFCSCVVSSNGRCLCLVACLFVFVIVVRAPQFAVCRHHKIHKWTFPLFLVSFILSFHLLCSHNEFLSLWILMDSTMWQLLHTIHSSIVLFLLLYASLISEWFLFCIKGFSYIYVFFAWIS